MRLPFLQVDADFLATGARDLAELLATSEADAGWSMVRLWGWAVSKAATPAALGLLEGPDMQRLAERAAGWTGEQGAFLAALLNPALALAQSEEGGAVRLLGLDRYAATFRKMEADRLRKSGGSRGAVARNSAGTPSEVARKTQTQTQTQKEEAILSAGADAPGDDLPEATEHAEEEQPLLVAVPAKPSETPEALRALWNEVAHPSLARWQGLSSTRKASAAARLRERPLAEWRGLIERISRSPFCRGENDRGWKADPEFLLRPGTAEKVLEGKYDRPGGSTVQGGGGGKKESYGYDNPFVRKQIEAMQAAKKGGG